ncbi:MAG: ATP-binding cassette domain-containing protein [Pseudomonadota bacterium]
MKPEAELKADIFDGSATAVPEPPHPDETPGVMADRGTPNWARYASFLFAIGTGACLLAIAVLSVFYQSLVAVNGNTFALPLLLSISVVPVIGALILDYCHARALAGFRAARQRSTAMAQAAVAALAFVVLTVLHPVLGLAIPVCTGGFYLTLLAVRRFGTYEKLWEFRPSEAAAVLAGRDEEGLRLATAPVQEHAMAAPIAQSFSWLALLMGFAIASWLVAQEVVALPAVAAVAIISFWATSTITLHLRYIAQPDWAAGVPAAQVEQIEEDEDAHAAGSEFSGLKVQSLSVEAADGTRLLSDVSFDVARGEIIGVVGEAASGKSMLLNAIINPFDLAGLRTVGRVSLNEEDLWARSNREGLIPLALVPPTPKILPASGLDNLTCFQGGHIADRGLRCLENLVFSSDAVERISRAPDATLLSSADQKALSLARAFLMAPSLYLLDRPEDFASEKLLAALVDRIKMEANAGRSFVIITDNRAILESCTKLLMLREGRVVDFAPADEIRGRMSSGWLRFVTARRLESEDTLTTWVKSHFKRSGDEANRAKLCTVAAELLAFSCQDVRPMSLERACFDFKHFEGYALLKLIDESTLVSSGQMQLAHRDAAEAGDAGRLGPLAKVVRLAQEIDQELVDGRRVITVKVATYDPRKSNAKVNHG